MSQVVKRRWPSGLGSSGLPRRDRRGCDYEAYIPDMLSGRAWVLHDYAAADVADAERAVTALNADASALTNTEALARLLIRTEAVASSKIEGLSIGARRLLHAEAKRRLLGLDADEVATEILNNIEAMTAAIDAVGADAPIAVEIILDLHARLLAGTRLDEVGGQLRATQNWIGGSDYNPCSAEFVPPPPERVPDLIEDLIAFSNEDGLPAVAQAAIAHAQFETIHPFADGNGRAGRALMQMILRRRGLTARILPPISLVLASMSQSYVDGLMMTRYRGPATGKAAVEATSTWIGRFSAATSRACEQATGYERRASELVDDWRARLGTIRKGSATDRILGVLPGAPVLTIESAASLLSVSDKPAAEAIGRLEQAGILRQTKAGARNRTFECPEVIQAFTDLERGLAVPPQPTP
jgi:Fic family protein